MLRMWSEWNQIGEVSFAHEAFKETHLLIHHFGSPITCLN